MISDFLFWTLYPKAKTRKSWNIYKNWKFSVIRNWNTFHMTSNSKWFGHIVHHVVAGLCLLIASDSSRFIKLSPFLFMSVSTLKVIIVVEKRNCMHLSVINLKVKIIRDFQDFVLKALHPKTKTWKSRKFYKNAIILKYEDIASKTNSNSLVLFKLLITLLVCLGRIKMFLFSIFYHYR